MVGENRRAAGLTQGLGKVAGCPNWMLMGVTLQVALLGCQIYA